LLDEWLARRRRGKVRGSRKVDWRDRDSAARMHLDAGEMRVVKRTLGLRAA
jgi:hypothetical protein